ncbi:MAG: DUF1801 domain-containing protein [Actinomycetota bacterium]|nr:DUF1801 domain-containing protein [Actinomycetota bacterium]
MTIEDRTDDRATAYIAALPSPQREICQRLRELILGGFPDLTEAFKYNFPAYMYGPKRVCSTGGFKAHANLELDFGAHVDDPDGRVEGVGKNIRHIKIRSVDEIDEAYFLDLLQKNLDFYLAR